MPAATRLLFQFWDPKIFCRCFRFLPIFLPPVNFLPLCLCTTIRQSYKWIIFNIGASKFFILHEDRALKMIRAWIHCVTQNENKLQNESGLSFYLFQKWHENRENLFSFTFTLLSAFWIFAVFSQFKRIKCHQVDTAMIRIQENIKKAEIIKTGEGAEAEAGAEIVWSIF